MVHEVAHEVAHFITDTIASGTTSGVINLKGGTLVGVIIPASIASATFTIQASITSTGTFYTLKDPVTNTSFTGTITASGWYYIAPSVTAGLKYFKFVFDQSETAKTYTYIYRPID